MVPGESPGPGGAPLSKPSPGERMVPLSCMKHSEVPAGVCLAPRSGPLSGHEGLVLKRRGSSYHVSEVISVVTPDWLRLEDRVRVPRAGAV